MRILLWFLLPLIVLVSGLWYLGEGWLAKRSAEVIAAQPGLTAETVSPLRDWRRIGLHVEGLVYEDPTSGLSLPFADVWVGPLSLTNGRVALPSEADITLNGQPLAVQMQDEQLLLHMSPIHEMAVKRVSLQSAGMGLNGQAALADILVDAKLTGLGHNAPPAAGASYDIDLVLSGLNVAALAPLGLQVPDLPDALGGEGRVRVWLTDAPGRGLLSGAAVQPDLVGFQTDGVTLRIGKLSARIVGRVGADAQGRAEGRLALYTSDAPVVLQMGVDAGLIPPAAIKIGHAAIQAIAAISPDKPREDEADSGRILFPRRVEARRAAAQFPEPAEGELRLPIFLRDGRIFLGAIPIGPAPQFPAI